MKIEEGKFYRTRDGQKVGPVRRKDRDSGTPWIADQCFDDWVSEWRETGSLLSSGQPHPLDLVAEWTEGPVRTVTRKEIVPGDYGIVKVTTNPHVWVSIGVFREQTPAELRAAAATLTEIADALETP